MTARRKPVVAWAVIRANGRPSLHPTKAEALTESDYRYGKNARGVVLKLVEADPLRDAVVRAAVRWSRVNDGTCTPNMEAALARRAFWAAVERLQKRGKR